jgi:hypothetical protein
VIVSLVLAALGVFLMIQAVRGQGAYWTENPGIRDIESRMGRGTARWILFSAGAAFFLGAVGRTVLPHLF